MGPIPSSEAQCINKYSSICGSRKFITAFILVSILSWMKIVHILQSYLYFVYRDQVPRFGGVERKADDDLAL
jgi:hypothetical protein